MGDLANHLALGISNCRTPRGIRQAVEDASNYSIRRVYLAEDIGCRDAFTLAAMVASDIDVDITIAVTNPYLRSPATLAAATLTLTAISTGSVSLGLGSSNRTIISGQLGLPYGDSIEIMRSTVKAIREENRQRGIGLRLILAAMGPGMLRLAGAVADGVVLNTGTTPPYVRWARARIAEGATEAGRNPSSVGIAVWVPVYAGPESQAERLDRARRWAASMLSIPHQGELLLRHADLDASFLDPLRATLSAYPHTGDEAAAAALIPEEVVRTLAIVDSPAGAAGRLGAYLDEGVETIVTGPSGLFALVGATS